MIVCVLLLSFIDCDYVAVLFKSTHFVCLGHTASWTKKKKVTFSLISYSLFETKIFTIIKSWRCTSHGAMGMRFSFFSLLSLSPFRCAVLCFCVETILQLFGSQFFSLSVLFIFPLADKSMLLCLSFSSYSQAVFFLYAVKAFQIMIINKKKTKLWIAKYATFFYF